MKRKLKITELALGFIGMVLLLTSCSKNELKESMKVGSELSFRVNSEKITKAETINEVDINQLKTKNLNIYAYDKNGEEFQFNDENGNRYSDNIVSLSYDGKSSEWTPENNIYLTEETDKYPVALYSSFPDMGTYYTSDKGKVSFEYNTYEKTTDLLVSTSSITNQNTAIVQIPYQHALAQIIVRVTNNIPGGYDLEVNSCIISSVASSGVYEFGTGWSSTVTRENLYCDTRTEEDKILSNATEEVIGRFMAVPIGKETINSKLIYQLHILDGSSDFGRYIDGEFDQLPSINVEAGKRYYIDLVVTKSGALKFNVSITNWDDATTPTTINI